MDNLTTNPLDRAAAKYLGLWFRCVHTQGSGVIPNKSEGPGRPEEACQEGGGSPRETKMAFATPNGYSAIIREGNGRKLVSSFPFLCCRRRGLLQSAHVAV